jgi:hypothetical protein
MPLQLTTWKRFIAFFYSKRIKGGGYKQEFSTLLWLLHGTQVFEASKNSYVLVLIKLLCCLCHRSFWLLTKKKKYDQKVADNFTETGKGKGKVVPVLN